MRSRVELFEQIRRDKRIEDLVDPGAGGPASGAPADGAAGVGRRSAATAEDLPAAVAAGDRAVGGGDRRLAARGPEGPAQAAAHRPAGLAAPRRGARGDGVGGDGVPSRRPPPGRARPGPRGGGDPADPPAGCGGGGRLRRVPRGDRRGPGEVLVVRDAAVALRAGVPRRVRHPSPGSVPGRTCAGVPALRRCPGPGPLRQPEAGGDPCAARPGPGRVRTVRRAAVALRVRLVLLPARDHRRARERRRRG